MATNVFIGGKNLMGDATIITDDEVSTLPADNLKDFQVSVPFRTQSVTSGYQIISVLSDTLGKPIGAFGLLNTNFTQDGTWSIWCGGAPRNQEAESRNWGYPDFEASGIANYDTTGVAPTIDASGHVVYAAGGFGTLTPSTTYEDACGIFPNGNGYLMEIKISGRTAGSIRVTAGGVNTDINTNGTHYYKVTSGDTTGLRINDWILTDIAGTFDGTVEHMKIMPIVYSSEDMDLIGRAIPWGALPFGSFPFYGKLPAAEYAAVRKNAIQVFDSNHAVSTIWVELDDATNGDGYFEIGRAWAGFGFKPSINMSCDWSLPSEDQSVRSKSVGGQAHFEQKTITDSIKLELGNLTRAQKHGFQQMVARQAGITRDVLIVGRPDDREYYPTEAIHGTFLKMPYPKKQGAGAGSDERWKIAIELEELI